MSRKKVVGKSIQSYFRKGHVSDAVNDIEVDVDRLEKALDDPSTYERADAVYEKFGMRKYKDIDEFTDYMSKFNPNMPMSDIEKLWADYEHRDDLILSGQYEEYRLQLIKDNYLEAAKKSGLSEKVIHNIENLPLDKWDKMVYYPSDSKETTYDQILPRIGEFTYAILNVEYGTEDDPRIELEDRIKEAFEKVGVEWIDYESNFITRGKKYLERRNVDIEEELEEYREENEEDFTERDELDIIASYIANDLKARGREIRIGKKSEYLPGIGSSKPGTKNRDLFLAISKYMK